MLLLSIFISTDEWHSPINPIHLILIELHHLFIIHIAMWFSIDILTSWVIILLLRLSTCNLWKQATLSIVVGIVQNRERLLLILRSLSGYRLVLSPDLLEIFLNFLLSQLDLVLYIVMSLIYIRHLLKLLYLILSSIRYRPILILTLISVKDMDITVCRTRCQVNGINSLFVLLLLRWLTENVFLNIFTHL